MGIEINKSGDSQLSYPGVYSRRLRDEPTCAELIDNYDWWAAFGFAAPQFTMEDVEQVVLMAEGERDEEDWLAVFKLRNGKLGALMAGCDYTGWD